MNPPGRAGARTSPETALGGRDGRPYESRGREKGRTNPAGAHI